jgi:Fe-S-cluster containining protein
MVAGIEANEKIIKEIAGIYEWLDSQVSSKISGECEACGKCCDFKAFDQRLFVTLPELLYLAEKLNVEKLKPMSADICPYNVGGKCTVYEYRFSGCRIFNCKADVNIQSDLSEAVLEKLKEVSEKFRIPYRYVDLTTALNVFNAS